MKYALRLSVLLILLFLISCSSEFTNNDYLYVSKNYKVTDSSVIEGDFLSISTSDTFLLTNYISKKEISTKVELKFGINAENNEMPAMEKHQLIVEKGGGSLEIVKFGNKTFSNTSKRVVFFDENTTLKIRLDMTEVLDSLNKVGWYVTNTNDTVYKEEFKSVHVIGNIPPLSWDMTSEFSLMNDLDGDGIYEKEIIINSKENTKLNKLWYQKKDLSNYPTYSSSNVLMNTIYNMTLEELIYSIERINKESEYAQEWYNNNEISFSIFSSLAIVMPEVSMNLLKNKIEDQMLIQEKGIGGSWPVTTDRISWAIAAWEVFKVTGNRNWLDDIYVILDNTIKNDLQTVFSKETGLVKGEQPFAGDVGNNYPEWMEPIDIFETQSLGTNVLHFKLYNVLSEIANELGRPSIFYQEQANRIKNAINTYLWLQKKGYYSEYLYGRSFFVKSKRSENLGEALSVLFDVANNEQKELIIENTPLQILGIPYSYPKKSSIKESRESNILPFISGFYAWAATKTKNTRAVEYGMASIVRQSGFLLNNTQKLITNKETIIIDQGKQKNNLLNLSSTLALYYRVLLGMEYSANKVSFSPFIPPGYDGLIEFRDLKYRNSILNIDIKGFGNKIKSFKVDGKEESSYEVTDKLRGSHYIEIVMNSEVEPKGKINLSGSAYLLQTPEVKLSYEGIQWNTIQGAQKYGIIMNGEFYGTTSDTFYVVTESEAYREYQVFAISNTKESFLSEPVVFVSSYSYSDYETESFYPSSHFETSNFNGKGFLELKKYKNRYLNFKITIEEAGKYLIKFRYANGEGSPKTGDKCAIRSLYVNNVYIDAAVFPQRGENNWSDWGFSNPIKAYLKEGLNKVELKFEDFNENMNGKTNHALIDQIILIKL